MLFFPGYLEKLKVSGIKWVSGFPGNITNKLPTIVGVLILNDCETGMWSKKVFVCVCVHVRACIHDMRASSKSAWPLDRK